MTRDTKKSAQVLELRRPPSDEEIKSLISLAADWYWEQDERYVFTRFIGKVFDRSGLDPQRLIGTMRWHGGAVPLGDGGRWDTHRALLEAHKPFTHFIYQRVSDQGEPQYLSVSGQPVFDVQGKFKGYRGISSDVTERIEIERRLAIENAIARILIESSGIADAAPKIIREICEPMGWTCGARWDVDVNGRRLHCAETYSRASASAAVEAFLASMKSDVWIAMPPAAPNQADIAQAQTVWVRDLAQAAAFPCAPAALAAGLCSAFTFPIAAGGEKLGVFVFFAGEIHRPDARLVNGVLYLGGQIGHFWQRTLAEDALREIGQRFQHMTEVSPDWHWEHDEYYRFNHISGNDIGKTGLQLNDPIGKTYWELPFLNVKEEQWSQLKATLDARRAFFDMVLMCRGNDGGLCYVSLSGQPFFDGTGKCKGYRGVGKDVTERERDIKIRRLVDSNVIGCLFTEDLSGVITDANDAFLQIVGYTREDLNAGKVNWVKMTPPEYHAAMNRATLDLQTKGQTHIYEKEYIRKDGKRIPVLIGSTQFGGSMDKGASFILDLSERVKAEEKVLRESEARFRSLTELSSDWYWEQDDNFRFVFLSDGLGQKTGLIGSYVGKTFWNFPTLNLTQEDWVRHRTKLAKHEPFYDFEMRFPENISPR
ncbi:MAG: PAS domain S-box protein [Gammaproteobacteria bacterium]|nr:PAS domain S-box protein [Gammaproteobacteria bacterium]